MELFGIFNEQIVNILAVALSLFAIIIILKIIEFREANKQTSKQNQTNITENFPSYKI